MSPAATGSTLKSLTRRINSSLRGNLRRFQDVAQTTGDEKTHKVVLTYTRNVFLPNWNCLHATNRSFAKGVQSDVIQMQCTICKLLEQNAYFPISASVLAVLQLLLSTMWWLYCTINLNVQFSAMQWNALKQFSTWISIPWTFSEDLVGRGNPSHFSLQC